MTLFFSFGGDVSDSWGSQDLFLFALYRRKKPRMADAADVFSPESL